MASPQPIRFADTSVLSGANAESRLDPEMVTILEVLRAGERFLVCSHSRPDGDAIGSMLAMGMLLRQMGKRVDLVAADRIPPVYRGLPGAQEIRHVMRVNETFDGPYDAVVLLECDGLERTRLRGLERMRHINIDHHASGKRFGEWNWIDRHACSVGELVHRMVKAVGGTVTAEMATCLYVTLLTDTGGFCYGGIEANTFRLAGELVDAGADPVAIARDVYFANPFSKLQILGTALSHMRRAGSATRQPGQIEQFGTEDEEHGAIAWLWVSHADMVAAHASEEDVEGVVNYALSAAGVEAAIFLRELPEGQIRLSLRGKGRVNVAAIATQLGGGGHENASGCTLDGPLMRAAEEILAAVREEFVRSSTKSHGL
jgi:phosphoesterase RecJ-like protein